MSNFKEYIANERKQLKKIFSREAYYNILLQYLNDPDFESHIVVKKNGKAKKIKNYPVKKFRKILYNVLIDFGVDEKDAEEVMTTYKFKKKTVEGMYDFISDFVYQYLQSGRKLKLYSKEDSVASIALIDKKGEKNKRRKVKGELTNPVDTKDHKVLKAQSPVPEWDKVVKDANTGEVLKSIEIEEE